ncbi:serine hydrolase [Lysobacter helvus]|uniref:Serine hydrolase n=2 Tax=Lysobacteraceae TaxID=32033 RepID=A0ABN6FP90_9GAMM|nr:MULTISPECIES: serine hydrolase domain-containing protein [Lysobacter]BCT91400.1 serine hydrolase [Lysobacter caseinilyticus]BCT94553.1 serine hydrolase [Lysobacter helvus]
MFRLAPLALSCLLATAAVASAAMAAPVSTAPAAARFDAKALATALDARIDDAARAGFSGTVLVADGTHVVYERSVGLADPAGAKIGPDTRFNMASTGKLFTTVSILQLVQQGKLDLDAPIRRYLPKWPVASVRDHVTVRELLMHTSGLGLYWGEDFQARRASLHTLSDYIPLLAKEPEFTPGTAWRYSNSGFMVLGLIVEAVSKQDYYAYVAEHIFQPAGMHDTGYFEVDGKATNVATPMPGGTGADAHTALRMPEPRGGAAGGGYSTPRDLLKFHRALTVGKLLDAKTRALLFAPVTLPAGSHAPPHGLGLLRFAVGNDVGYGHPGGAPGVGVDFRATRDSGWSVIVMSNSGSPRTMPFADALLGDVAAAGAPDLRFPMP